jgi:branched-chain amino acid aminotransferase
MASPKSAPAKSSKHHSKTWTFFEGDWREGNPPLMGPRTHAFWLASSVFDGARHFEGVTPDMARHAERVNNSAGKLGLKAVQSAEAIVELVRDGVKKFDGKAALYVRPMYWAEYEGTGSVVPDPDETRFCLCLYEAPMPEPHGASLCVSPFRRPTVETMPTDVKTGALYPNNARAMRDAIARGYTNALMLDVMGNVAETASSNIWLAKDGVAYTPIPNSCFLNGITRQRNITNLRSAGVVVVEKALTVADILAADEVFTTGNFAKVMPITKVIDKEYQPGPMFRRARELYWEFAHGSRNA